MSVVRNMFQVVDQYEYRATCRHGRRHCGRNRVRNGALQVHPRRRPVSLDLLLTSEHPNMITVDSGRNQLFPPFYASCLKVRKQEIIM